MCVVHVRSSENPRLILGPQLISAYYIMFDRNFVLMETTPFICWNEFLGHYLTEYQFKNMSRNQNLLTLTNNYTKQHSLVTLDSFTFAK